MKYLLLLAFIACTPQPKKINPAVLLLLQSQPEPTIQNDGNYCARCYGDSGLPITDDGVGATK